MTIMIIMKIMKIYCEKIKIIMNIKIMIMMIIIMVIILMMIMIIMKKIIIVKKINMKMMMMMMMLMLDFLSPQSFVHILILNLEETAVSP